MIRAVTHAFDDDGDLWSMQPMFAAERLTLFGYYRLSRQFEYLSRAYRDLRQLQQAITAWQSPQEWAWGWLPLDPGQMRELAGQLERLARSEVLWLCADANLGVSRQ